MEYIVSREGIGYSIKGKLNEANTDTLKTVIRQNWKEKLDVVEKAKGSKHISAALERHLSHMNSIIDPIDYEAFCVPNIIQHSRHMPKEDFDTYLRLIESMAIGYSNDLGKDLTSAILIGVTLKGRSVGSAKRYYNLIIDRIGAKADRYQKRINKRSRKIEIMSTRLRSHQKSILRFMKGRKINALSRNISSKNRELESLRGQLENYNIILSRINETVRFAPAPAAAPKPQQ